MSTKFYWAWPPLLLVILAPVGCLRPPVDEKVPTYSMKESWKTEPAVANVSTCSSEKWWEIFEDKQLNAYIEEGLLNSPTMEQAFARFDQAMCITTITGASQYPQLALNGYGDRRRVPEALQSSASVPTGQLLNPNISSPIPVPNTGVPPIVVPAIPQMKTITSPGHVNDLIANFLVSYEVDFWGKYYMKTQAATRRAEASEADVQTSRLLLANQIAGTYFTIQAMKAELLIVREEVAVHRELVQLLSWQCDRGLTNAFELLNEQALLENTVKEESSLSEAKEQNEVLLAVLLGREPNEMPVSIEDVSWSFPVVPAGLPSSLLAQRPDIRSHIKEVEALIAEIGVAKTELLPSISLSAAAGYQAGLANQWFKWKDRIWSLAASVSQPIFDAGQRFAEVDAAKARFRESAASLTQSVLTSVKEVEDALVAIRTQKERRTAALQKEEDLSCTTELRKELCATGVQNYLVVLQSKQNQLRAKRERVNEEYNLQLSTLALMKGLGGSWGTI